MSKKTALVLQKALSPGPHELRHILESCEGRELFMVGIENKRLWQTCFQILRDRKGNGPPWLPAVAAVAMPILPLPFEIHLEILELLDVRDLTSLRQTCRFFWSLCTRLLEGILNRFFSRFGLDAASVRFMLTQTDSLLSGYFAFHLARMNRSCLKQTRTLEVFVCGDVNAVSVEQFFAASAGFTRASVDNKPAYRGILQSVHLRRDVLGAVSTGIVLHYCRRNPRADVFNQPLTCLHTWMSGSGIFVAYADLTLRSETIPLPS
ncbi:hypothetical protein K438DRAFT_1954068 [Mycena galopus ATCC 62051]|nr:hypothetical protein K438DRAFT_1954068 [Mycena galopus ATCC 62051]